MLPVGELHTKIEGGAVALQNLHKTNFFNPNGQSRTLYVYGWSSYALMIICLANEASVQV